LRHIDLWRDPVGSSGPTGQAILADFSKYVNCGPPPVRRLFGGTELTTLDKG